jgi:hypothetical protein
MKQQWQHVKELKHCGTFDVSFVFYANCIIRRGEGNEVACIDFSIRATVSEYFGPISSYPSNSTHTFSIVANLHLNKGFHCAVIPETSSRNSVI